MFTTETKIPETCSTVERKHYKKLKIEKIHAQQYEKNHGEAMT